MKHKKIIIIISIIIAILLIRFIILNSNYYKLKTLYKNPININVVSGDYTYDEYSNHVAIMFYDGNDSEVTIPSKIKNKKVYSIDDSAFYGKETITKVIVPDTVIRIGHQAFIGSNNLKEVYLPNNIVDIGPYAFDKCTNLEKIYVKKNSKTDKALKKTKFYKYVQYK